MPFAKLYRQYHAEVYCYLYGLTKNRQLAEDLTSETFLAAMQAIATFEGRCSMRTWLFSIARHKWCDSLRRNKGELSLEDMADYYFQVETGLTQQVSRRQTVRRALELMDRLPPRSREILLLRIQGFSFCEIAKQYGITESSARVVDFRARNQIKNDLLQEGYEYE